MHFTCRIFCCATSDFCIKVSRVILTRGIFGDHSTTRDFLSWMIHGWLLTSQFLTFASRQRWNLYGEWYRTVLLCVCVLVCMQYMGVYESVFTVKANTYIIKKQSLFWGTSIPMIRPWCDLGSLFSHPPANAPCVGQGENQRLQWAENQTFPPPHTATHSYWG